jgi:predicted AAA+ superfamily ATPase
VDRADCYFWGTHGGAELDLLVVQGRQRLGFEVKRTVAPRISPSMRSALSDLRLDSLDLIHAGAESFPLGPGMRALAFPRLLEDLQPLAQRSER